MPVIKSFFAAIVSMALGCGMPVAVAAPLGADTAAAEQAEAPAAALAPAAAAEPEAKGPSETAKARFPQPVRVGDLGGRTVLEPREDQPVLGHVAGLVRKDGGDDLVLIELGGWLGLGWFGTRVVPVPVGAVALLGEYVALMDLTPEQLDALPTFEPASAVPIPPDETIRVGIVRPFH